MLMVLAIIGSATSADAQGFFHGHKSGRSDSADPPTVEDVGCMIDELDKELFKLGTINVKAPDVWGQNRMTKYRTDFETQMAKDVGNFQFTLSAALRRADLAVLISGTSIGAALNPAGAAAPAAAAAPTAAAAPAAAAPAATTSSPSSAAAPAATAVTPPSPDITSQLQYLASRIDNLANTTNLLQIPQGTTVGLEPTLNEDEKANFINHLNELRRINAGDDLTDAPGYGLYLVRMPVSLLPGPAVQKGKGALVNVEARHILPPDLLANTFRSVVIMDTTYQLDPLLLKILHKVIKLDPDEFPTACLPRPGVVTSAPPAAIGQLRARAAVASQIGAGNPSGVSGTLSLSDAAEVYGYDVLKVLIDAIEKDRGDWYVHDASLLSWLVNELATAHRFMQEQARDGLLSDMFHPARFQQLDQIVQQRNYSGLFDWRCRFLKELVSRRNGQAAVNDDFVTKNLSVTDVLVYALMVQSVLVERQLKHDIDIMVQRKGFACADLNTLSFYDLFPSPEAQESFNAYVACKWPIHIFSLDPTTDQQNELDLFSARSELQVALAVALSSGAINFNQATSYARQLQTDLETINLNQTAVGFGAGETTFGWRFYPRIQSPPTQNNIQRIGGLLLGSNYGQNYMERHRKIEPGLRECVALVVTPNFIPAIRFTTSANWFEINGQHANQKLDTGDMLRLSHQVQTAKNALSMVCDAGHYRPGEVERLADRLAQLEAQLPLQYYRVPLPFEGDLTGSEIFTSEGGQLAPRLLAWYGEPPKVGVNSTIFLLGTNFGIGETDVIAGGVPADVQLMSRNVMQITINSSARPKTTADKRLIFDIHAATPNGISNHLFAETDAADASATTGGTRRRRNGILGQSHQHRCHRDAVKNLQNNNRWQSFTANAGSSQLVIDLNEPTGMLPPSITPVFSFPLDGNQSLQDYKDIGLVQYDPDNDGYTITAQQIEAMTVFIAKALDTAGQLAPGKIPTGVNSKPIKIKATVPNFIHAREADQGWNHSQLELRLCTASAGRDASEAGYGSGEAGFWRRQRPHLGDDIQDPAAESVAAEAGNANGEPSPIIPDFCDAESGPRRSPE